MHAGLETAVGQSGTQGFRAGLVRWRLARQTVRPEDPTSVSNDAAFHDLAADVAFLQYHGIPYPALWRASRRAEETGINARRCLMQAGAIDDGELARLIAQRFDLEDNVDVLPEAEVSIEDAMRRGWFRAHGCDGRPLLVVSTLGASTAAFFGVPDALQFRRPVTVMPERAFIECLRSARAGDIARDAAASVAPGMSALGGMTHRQRSALLIGAILLAAALAAAGNVALIAITIMLGWLFLASTVLQLAAALFPAPRVAAPPRLSDAALPRYSILVPLHREERIIGQLVEALNRIDYPKERLQILLLVEEADDITRQAILRHGLPSHIATFLVPPGKPTTKPRALNAAMSFVTGDFVVVYDAEDRPDPMQLRLAVARFAGAHHSTGCLQARLVIDNSNDSWLTRFFALEYAALFDVTKSGSAVLGIPIPLGGTSNHFRASVLRQIGLWDAWNVTEDADLGYRLARHGYAVADLPSDTLEEAPAQLQAWMAQRTRWLKGWMQTVITHSRYPLRTLWGMGPANFIAAVLTSTGVLVGTLVSPVFAVLAIMRMRADEFMAGTSVLDTVADSTMTIVAIYGIASIYIPALVAARRRKLTDLIPWIALLPLYHVLLFFAGWRAVYELIVAPYRWNKTTHGLAKSSRSASRAKL